MKTGSRGIHRIFGNTAWLLADKLVRMGLGLFVGIWVARYLAPDAFGTLNYGIAFVALFTPLATLGLETILVRELVKAPGASGLILGSAWLLRLVAGLAAMAFAAIGIYLIRSGDAESRILVIILSSAVLFQSFDIFDLWFQSRTASQYAVLPRMLATLAASGLKVYLILNHYPLLAFAWTTVAEAMLVAMGLFLSFKAFGERGVRMRPDPAEMKRLFVFGRPLILTGLMIMIYMRIDQIMIGQMAGNIEVGIYSAAVKIAEIWYFIPMSISASIFPALAKSKLDSEGVYLKRLAALYSVMTWMSILFAVGISILSPFIVNTLYGQDYAAAAPILSLSCWAGVFVAQGVARGQWMIIENLQRYTIWYIGGAAMLNVVLNIILIPKYGSFGAAAATLAAQGCAALVIPAFFRSTRPSSLMLLQSFNPASIFSSFALLRAAMIKKS